MFSYELYTSESDIRCLERIPQVGTFLYGRHGIFCTSSMNRCVIVRRLNQQRTIVGAVLQRFDHKGKKIFASGTRVVRNVQGEGVASRMWKISLESCPGVKAVYVTVISDKGYTLINSLRQQHPMIRWNIIERGKRVLRDLKG